MVSYKKIVFVSLAITILVFFSGLLLGLSVDDTRLSDLVTDLNKNELNRESYLVEQDFISSFGGDACELSNTRVEVLSNELGSLGRLLTKYESKGTLRSSEYDYLKSRYFLLEIKTYTLLNNLKQKCGYNFNTILFFYDINDQSSLNQGYVLDSLVQNQKSVHVFSFDRNFNEPALETLKSHYNVIGSPSLVINDGLVEERLMGIEELKSLL